MGEGETYNFDVDQLTLTQILYTEFALDTQEINSQTTIGGKLKYSYGHGNIQSDFSDLKLMPAKPMGPLLVTVVYTQQFPD